MDPTILVCLLAIVTLGLVAGLGQDQTLPKGSRMADRGRQPHVVAAGEAAEPPGDRRSRLWYNLSLLAFLIGPALAALAVMDWWKAP